jgi:hypothetical protein
MVSTSIWARGFALTAAVALASVTLPAGIGLAQETPSVTLEQGRAGEDGTSGAGATSGNMTSGEAKRDKDGNASTATAGSGGTSGGGEEASAVDLPENAELLEALGILDDVTVYGLDVLTGLNIPVELLPPPPAAPVSAEPVDVNTGGLGGSSTISAEPGSGAAPAGGSISSAAEDGVGSSTGGDRERDRPRRNDNGGGNGG